MCVCLLLLLEGQLRRPFVDWALRGTTYEDGGDHGWRRRGRGYVSPGKAGCMRETARFLSLLPFDVKSSREQVEYCSSLAHAGTA